MSFDRANNCVLTYANQFIGYLDHKTMKEKVGLEDEGEGRAVNTLTVVTGPKLRLFRGYSESLLYR